MPCVHDGLANADVAIWVPARLILPVMVRADSSANSNVPDWYAAELTPLAPARNEVSVSVA